MENQTIELLSGLFRQRENINTQILEIIGSGGGETKGLTKKVKRTYNKKEQSEDVEKSENEKSAEAKRPHLSDVEKENIIRCWQAGDVTRVLCKKFNISPATVFRLVSGLTRDREEEPTLE